MRKHKQHRVYHSILPALQEPGCPFCRLLKEFQAECLQTKTQRDLHRLCNFHAWGLAAVLDAPDAASIFMRLLDEMSVPGSAGTGCDICRDIVDEENLRIREFVSCSQSAAVVGWFKTGAALCIPHGMKLRPKLPPTLVPRIDNIMQQYRQQLHTELEHLRDGWDPQHNRSGWGAVGHAAEFLVAHRGLRAKGESQC